MKTICHLDSSWGSLAGAVGVVAGAIATDEFGRLALAQPGTQTIGRTIGQEVHHLAGGHVYQHRAEAVTTAQREVIDAEDPWRENSGHRLRSDEPDQGHAAHSDGAAFGKPRAGTAADGQSDILQQAQQGDSSASTATRELRHLLGKRATRAVPGSTPESTDQQMDLHRTTTDWLVSNPTCVVAMHPP